MLRLLEALSFVLLLGLAGVPGPEALVAFWIAPYQELEEFHSLPLHRQSVVHKTRFSSNTVGT